MFRSVPLAVRARRVLARPITRRVLVGVVALATGATVASLVRSAEAARDRWGDTRSVAVATRDLAPGDPLDSGAAEVRDLPLAVVPEGALAEPPVGAVVRHPVAAGEALVAPRIAPHGLTGAAALVPPGEQAIAVPLSPVAAPPLAVGDLVDLVAVLPVGGASGVTAASEVASDAVSGLEPAFPLVEAATVVDVGPDTASVAVPEGDAARVAFALVHGAIVVTLSGG